jgi:predicted nucleic acid-binding protein
VSYLDTSVAVAVAYYLPEPLSARVQAIYDAEAAPTISELVELEFFSTLSLRLRMGDLERPAAERVANLFLNHLEGGWYERVLIRSVHYLSARRFIAGFTLPLKPPDTLHLAGSSAERLRLVTADERMAANAARLGIESDLVRLEPRGVN